MLFNEIVSGFVFYGEFISADPLKYGNFNDTYVASFKKADGEVNRYILQKISKNVFNDINSMMKNVIYVTRHIQRKIKKLGGDPARETLDFIPAVKGGYVYKCGNGNFWRAYSYIDNVRIYQTVEEPIHFYNAGKAFGKFQKLLIDFPVEMLQVTIADFHHTAKRYDTFLQAVKNDPLGHVKDIRDEIVFIQNRGSKTGILINLLENRYLPLRVTHNNSKLNNVLFDNRTGEGICIIDLDTVMPGSTLFDFGDSIRSGANTADEDEPELSKVKFDLTLFEEFTRSYFEETHEFLTPIEIKYLPFSAILMTLELGIRFLTDYINGDSYFKIFQENSNLKRARVQLKLVADMEAKYQEMQSIVNEQYLNKQN